MSYVEWKTVEGRQEARKSGAKWRRIETFEADSPAGSEPISEFYQIAVKKCSHNDGLYCGRTEDQHPAICSCWNTGVYIHVDGHEYEGHEFQ